MTLSRSTMPTILLVALASMMLGLVTSAQAQAREATSAEITAIRDCAVKHKDNLDAIEQRCLFNLVATPCINKLGVAASNVATANCYETETAIWNDLLNDNYKALLATLDDEQTGKARAMQRAWIAYRDTTCQFYDDKIQGSMSIPMHAACTTRETARRAVLLEFFSRL
jgi:uncharacterized protein YecT (DUF1311 family)